MPDNSELSQETREQLELARSKVRRYLTYGAGAVAAFIFIWGTTWMGDRSIAIAGLVLCSNIICYWFGQRGSVKPPEIK